MTEDLKAHYDHGVIAGMTIGLTGAIGAAMHSAGMDGIPMLAGVMGKAFLPYIPHLEKINPNDCPRLMRKWIEILTELAKDVRDRQTEAAPRIVEG